MKQNARAIQLNKQLLLQILISFLGTLGMQGIMALPASENIRYSNSMFSFLLFIGLIYINSRILNIFTHKNRRQKIYAYIFALLFSIALHFGSRMESVDNVRLTDISLWFGTLCFAIAFAPLTDALWDKSTNLVSHLYQGKNDATMAIKYFNFYQVWAIVFLMWVPTFLALFPGAFVYDAQDEYIEVISRAFTTHHPLLHVLLIGGIIHAAEYIGWTANAGIATYVLIQMALMSFVLAYSIKLLQKLGLKKSYCTVVMVFYGIFPLFPMYAVCTAKDGLFTTFFFVVILLLTEFIYSKDQSFFTIKNMLLFVASSLLMMLFRNNGMYAYLVSIPFIFLIFRLTDKNNKKKTSRLIVLMILSVILFFGADYILKTATDASDNEHQEMLTVPIQQIARAYTYSKDVFTEEDIDTLHEVLPEEYLLTYTTRVSDVLKSGFDNEAYASNKGKYVALWAQIGLRKPLIYLNAWLGTSYGYWYPDAINNVYKGNQMYTFQYGDSSYFGFETEAPGVRDSKFRVLETFYKNLSLQLFQQRIPVVSMLFAPGFVFWIFAFVLVGLFRERRFQSLVPMILVLLLFLTVLLGPTTLVRYVLILWFIVPFYVCLYKE